LYNKLREKKLGTRCSSVVRDGGGSQKEGGRTEKKNSSYDRSRERKASAGKETTPAPDKNGIDGKKEGLRGQ